MDEARRRSLDIGRTRLLVTGGVFLLVFMVIVGRLVEVSLFNVNAAAVRHARTVAAPVVRKMGRADIVDRNGVVLATSLPTVNLYANPTEILDAGEAARKLMKVLPEANPADLVARLGGDRSFVYLRRTLTPALQYEVNRLGIPGVYFERGERRVYPHGNLVAHVIGMADIDGHGLAGVEKSFDDQLRVQGEPLRLSIDMRLQHLVREELTRSVEEFRALGATALVTDVATGEVLSMVSLPDFNPNNPGSPDTEALFNRATLGVYEMGSTFKLLTTAAALDAGTCRIEDRYDATNPIQIAKFTITDYHPQRRWLTVPEILIHSSNIGAAKMALGLGTTRMRAFLAKTGLLKAPVIELPEVGTPLVPSPWREISTITISYGHGLAVTPVHMSAAIGALVNGGIHYPATLLKQDVPPTGERVLSVDTSRKMRYLMRLVVEDGTGAKAEVPGYFVGGKTGTAEKNKHGHYAKKSLLSSFVSAFPMTDPKYAVIVIIDEPEGTKSTFGYATGGWTAAPAVGRIIARMAPLMGIAPVHTQWPGNNHANMVVQAVARGDDREAR